MREIAPDHETVYSGPPLEPRPARVPLPSEEDLQEIEHDLSRFMVHVFTCIAAALLISALFASYSDRYDGNVGSFLVGQSIWVVIAGAMALAYFVSRKVADMPVSVAMATLVAYAALQGVVFGLLYRSVYGASLAPVFVCISVLFSLLGIYGFVTGANLTGRPLLVAAACAPVLAFIFMRQLDLQLMAACAACVCSWLLLSLVGYHRDFLRDLPASFEDDAHGEKAAAVGALQIYIDLMIVMVIVLQARLLRESITMLQEKAERYKKTEL